MKINFPVFRKQPTALSFAVMMPLICCAIMGAIALIALCIFALGMLIEAFGIISLLIAIVAVSLITAIKLKYITITREKHES